MNTKDSGGEFAHLPLSAASVFDAAWEARTRKDLDPTGWDSGLAIQTARDALRVLSGELSDEEFHARYHEAYMREFGVDLRPRDERPDVVTDADGSLSSYPLLDSLETVSTVDGGEVAVALAGRDHPGISRRTAIRLAGGGVAALLLGDVLNARVQNANADTGDSGTGHASGHGSGSGTSPLASSEASSGKRKVRMGMVMDLEKCDGCLMCVGACRQAYALPDGVFWIYVMAFKEPDRPDDVNLLVRTCQHCSNAPCVKVCPTGARHRRDDGLVLTDYDVCFGCRYCQVSCPYGVNYFGWSSPDSGEEFTGERRDERGKKVIGAPPRGVMGKCIFDPQRQDSTQYHGTTHCQMACPMGVIHFGDLNDPESEPNQYLRRRIDESGGKLSTFHLLDDLGTKPNVIYIGHQPSRHAEPTANPTRYEDWGFVDERRIVLEGPEPWFKRVFGR